MSELYLALLLDAPLQSWGVSSKFQRRGTLLHPTRSGVVGMLCAAAGAAKGSQEEQKLLELLARIRMTVLVVPRTGGRYGQLPIRRLRDFHTVLNTRIADGKPNPNPVVTHREYLQDARFGVVLSGAAEELRSLEEVLRNPVWGVWFGRKCCLPAAPICRGLFSSLDEALRHLAGQRSLAGLTVIEEVAEFDEGTDSYPDVPLSFGLPGFSSGGRAFTYRRVCIRSMEE